MDDLIGRTLGQYEILQLLGKGGMASVYKAYQAGLQRYVAIKILPPHLAQNPEFSKRFEREARAIAQLDHPNIVPVYDYGQAEGFTFIVMKYVEGGTLKDMLERRGRLPLDRAALILGQVASALDYAHGQGVIHRDIKPANVLMNRPDWALLSDFGLVHIAEGSVKLTGTGVSLGTPEYMSPEQAQGLEIDARSDIYSLGVMLYAMTTGQAPFTGNTPVAVILKHVNEPLPSPRDSNPDLPVAAESAIRKALAKHPEERPSSAGELSRSFSTAIGEKYPVSDSEPQPRVSATPPTPKAEVAAPQAAAPLSPRRRLPLPLIAGAAIIAIAALGIGVLLGGRSGAPAPPSPQAVESTATPASAAAGALQLPIQSTVQIWVLQKAGDEFQYAWSGSGSIVTPDGLILTNAHVVLPDKVYGTVDGLEIWLTFQEDAAPEPTFLAQTVVADPDLDLAVVKIISDLDGNPVDPDTLNLPAVELGDSDELSMGAEVFILGYPGIGGENITLTNGRVAGFTNAPGVKGRAFVKTDATIAGGNSGGLAADASGRLIGIPTQLGYGGDDQYVDCRVLADTNGDGAIDERDGCVPTGGFINALRPINMAVPLIRQAQAGIVSLPTVEPEREPIPTPANAGEVLFSDDFSSPDSGWSEDEDEDTAARYEDGHMVIDVFTQNYVGWTNPGQSFDDVDVEVDTQYLGGPLDNQIGLIVRYQDADNFYVFSISRDGFYEFSKLVDGEWVTILPWSASDLIDQDSGQNRIAVVAEGDRFTFYINGVQVDQAYDGEFGDGDIGLLAGAFGEGGVSVGFDDLLARVPGGSHEVSVDVSPTADVQMILSDSFDDESGGWYVGSSKDVSRTIADGKLTIEVASQSYAGWSDLEDVELPDVVVELEVRKVSGPDLNAFGVLCRYQDSENYYALEIGSDGTYTIYRVASGEYASLVDWTSSEAIAPGTDANQLRVECIGDHLRLIANGVLLADMVDDALAGGSVALVVETFDDPGVSVGFDNVVVGVPVAGGGAEVLFSDDFSSPDSGWDRASDKDSLSDYVDGQYVIGVSAESLYVWANPGQSFTDVVVDVDATQVAGPDNNDYGVICRYQDFDNFYRILISGDGYYAFIRQVDGESTQLIDWTQSSAINQGAAHNHLTVICDGDSLALWVNDKFVAEASDDALAEGDIGLTAGTFNEAGVRVAFDNVIVTAP
ncbi:MAG TPA: protein kinase [Anaerolineae bacterium]|nr:protein kinase [Anaerolineae bacterium]